MTVGSVLLLLLLPILVRIPKHLGRLMVDPADPSHFGGAFKTRRIYTFTGFASDVGKYRDNIVQGHVSSSLGANGEVSSVQGAVNTTVVIHDQFVLTSADGTVRSFQMQGFNAAIGVGHVVSVAWTIRAHGSKGPYFLVYDHTTGEGFFNDRVLRKVIFPYPALYVVVLVLTLLSIPILVFVGLSGEWHLRRFKKSGFQPLLVALQSEASSLPRQPSLKVDELDRLAQLAREGLVTDEEWTRAKQLFLGKSPDGRTLTIEHLQQLYGLFRGGALSESEFNNKKWEILAREHAV